MEFRKKITGYTIHLDSKLGEGAFGKVYVGEEDNSKKRVAIKVLEKQKCKIFTIQLDKMSTSKRHYLRKSIY